MDKQLFNFFARSAMSPFHKVESIDNNNILKLLNEHLEDLPEERYIEILNSPKWKQIYGSELTVYKSKKLWFQNYIANKIDEQRLDYLKESEVLKPPRPYHLELFNNVEINSDDLIDISEIQKKYDFYPGQSYIIGNMKFVTYQSIGGVNSSYWLSLALKNLIKSGHKVFARLDPLIYNTISDFEDMHYLMQVWGKDFDWKRILNLRGEDHGQWIPDILGCTTALRTDYHWKTMGKEVHLTIEEIPKEDQIKVRGSRYFHAIIDKKTNSIIHCDGAIRIYDKINFNKRKVSHIKDPSGTKIGIRKKIFNILTPLSLKEFVSVCCNFFIWNNDVSDYFDQK